MEIEVVIRMEVNTEDFAWAEKLIKKYFESRDYIQYRGLRFREFYVMASQPINVGEDGT